jgi:hypothetical protein
MVRARKRRITADTSDRVFGRHLSVHDGETLRLIHWLPSAIAIQARFVFRNVEHRGRLPAATLCMKRCKMAQPERTFIRRIQTISDEFTPVRRAMSGLQP